MRFKMRRKLRSRWRSA